MTAVDNFLVGDSFADLGMAEFSDLYDRLTILAIHQEPFAASNAVRIRNACFDGITCIKALEAGHVRQRGVILGVAPGRIDQAALGVICS